MLVRRQPRGVGRGHFRRRAEVAVGRWCGATNCSTLVFATSGIAILLTFAVPGFVISVGFPQLTHSGAHDRLPDAASLHLQRSSGSSSSGIRAQSLVTRAASRAAKPVSRLQFKDLQVGQELKGLVVRTAPFGCFVDVGAEKEGLVHISQVSGTYVEDIEAVVEPGQMVTVWVRNINIEQGTLSLSMLRPSDPDAAASDDMDEFTFKGVDPKEWFQGTVVSITDFGLFLTLSRVEGGPASYGLVHISNIREGFVEHPAEEATVGQKVRVRVVDVPEDGRIKLSMREPRQEWVPAEEQDVSGFEGIQPTTWLQGRVDHIAPFGAFVELVAPVGGAVVQGMVHVGEIKDEFVIDPEQEVSVNEIVKVRVIKVDVASGKLYLSMKPLF